MAIWLDSQENSGPSRQGRTVLCSTLDLDPNHRGSAVGFGLIGTRLVQPLSDATARMEMRGHQIRLGVQPSFLDTVKTACPLRRLGTPEEAAGVVLFFCSPLSDYVTGELLICGGVLHF